MENNEMRANLERQVDVVTLDILAPHMERGQFFIVGPDLDFVDTALSLAMDDVEQVKLWIDAGKMKRPDPQTLEQWALIEGKQFRFVVVKPFLLIQEILSS